MNATNILYFNQDCNFDLAGNDNTCADERYNLLNILNDDGFIIDTLKNFHQADLEMRLAANDLLVIPDLEDTSPGNCNINDLLFLNDSEKQLLENYISGGGNLLITGSTQTVSLLNGLFGFSLVAVSSISTGVSTKNVSQAMGTPFENCPETLPNLTATFLLNTSMPDNKRCIYESGTSSSLAYFTYGEGTITYLGYDYNDVGPGCSVAGAIWISCAVDSGVQVAVINNTVLVPTLSQWGVIILVLSFIIVGSVYHKSTAKKILILSEV